MTIELTYDLYVVNMSMIKSLNSSVGLQETWKSIKGYDGLYEVSDHGQIRSLKRVNRYGRTVNQRLLVPRINGHAYAAVALYRDSVRKDKVVHRLVAEAFLDNPGNKPEVNHRDGVKHHNQVDNLEWATESENQRHAFDNGLNQRPHGDKSHGFKGRIQVLDEGGTLIATLSGHRDISSRGWHTGAVYDCCNGKRTRYKGMTFQRLPL